MKKWLGSVVTKFGDITELLRKAKGCTFIPVGMKTEWKQLGRGTVWRSVLASETCRASWTKVKSAQAQAHLDKAKVEVESLSRSTKASTRLIKSLDPDRKPTPKAKSKPT